MPLLAAFFNNENMRAKEFLDDYSVDDLDVFGRHEEHYSLDGLMEEYAKIYHESEVKKLRLSSVSEQFEQFFAFFEHIQREYNIKQDITFGEAFNSFKNK